MSDQRSEGQEATDRRSDGEDVRADYKTDKKCPECGAPIEDVRVSCPNCGYEYRESDYTDPEAGTDFRAGTAVDEEGKEAIDEDEDAAAPQASGDSQDEREPSLAAKIMDAGTGKPRDES